MKEMSKTGFSWEGIIGEETFREMSELTELQKQKRNMIIDHEFYVHDLYEKSRREFSQRIDEKPKPNTNLLGLGFVSGLGIALGLGFVAYAIKN